ncbi:MAG: polysaccharide biosynthesis/export family protein [Alloprevotella sp.]
MKKILLPLLTILLAFASCKTSEKILYLQDLQTGDNFKVQAEKALELMPGDKLSIIVTSSATPKLAQQFNLPIVTIQAGSVNTSSSNQVALYTIDESGCVDVPTLGRVKVSGISRSQAAQKIQDLLRESHLRDAVVTVNTYDQYITVLGEVTRPGRVAISKDNITLFEALGLAGDLTIQGRRDQIKVIREENGQLNSYFVDLRSKDVFNSPVYNLKQNDIIYVSPNKVRIGQSTNNDNSVRSISTWLSVSSVLISLGILIFR